VTNAFQKGHDCALDYKSAKGSAGFRLYRVAIIRRSWAKKMIRP
jgi:hypothetical protein